MPKTKTAKTAKPAKKRAASKPSSKPKPLAPGENPLVPHETLRQIYLKMLHSRLLAEHLAGKPKQRLATSVTGQEACRASIVQGLASGDLVADSQPGPLMPLLLGVPLAEALSKKASTPPPALLPWLETAGDRLNAALGAAFVLKHLKFSGMAVVFVEQDEAGDKLWRRCLTVAATQNLPLLFVALPGLKHDGQPRLTMLAQQSKAAGIAVEAADAVALYRVVQESAIRIRGGGGPVLIEPIAFRPTKTAKSSAPDPVQAMRQCVLERKAATEAWIRNAESAFRKQLLKA